MDNSIENRVDKLEKSLNFLLNILAKDKNFQKKFWEEGDKIMGNIDEIFEYT